MRTLVTGGAGFIGSHIVEALVSAGHEVHVVDSLRTGNIENLSSTLPFYQVDIRSDEMEGLMKRVQPEVIIHQAAQGAVSPSLVDPLTDLSLNIEASVKLLELARRNGTRKLIYASSAAIYGVPESLPITETHRIEPISPYGISKYVPELYLSSYSKLYGIDYTAFRYANVYGPRQNAKGESGVISIFINEMIEDRIPTILGTGEATRDYLYVKDLADAVTIALIKGNGQVYNLSTNTSVSVNEVYHLISEIMGISNPAHYGPERRGDILHSTLDNTKVMTELNWVPSTSLYEGLKQTIDWAMKGRS